MQTFLPYPSFAHSAAVLDRKRLGAQRKECGQIINTLMEKRVGGWSTHPAVKMWAGYEPALSLYLAHMMWEWQSRGYLNTLPCPLLPDDSPNPAYRWAEIMPAQVEDIELPGWLGREDVHSSHRARLLDKDPTWYGVNGWTDAPRTEAEGYVWPTKTPAAEEKPA